MSRNKKPRKRYAGPKYLPGTLPIRFSMPSEAKTELALQPHLILEAFKTGHGNDDGAYTLAAAINIGAVLSRSFEDQREVMHGGLTAIGSVINRGRDSGRWGMSGDEMKAIGAALSAADDMKDASRRVELRDAIKDVLREGV